MDTILIDGKAVAKETRKAVRKQVDQYLEQGLPTPKLAVILAGEDPASQTYVSSKIKACHKVHIESESVVLPASVTEEELLEHIRRLNQDPSVNGILVQLPLPGAIDKNRVIQAIDPHKDVDGFHIENVGALVSDAAQGFVPCTPAGIMELLKFYHIEIDGKNCVVIGRSHIVGKPVAALLQKANGTVTVCHTHTRDLPGFCRRADILVAAVGRHHMVDGSMIKEGAVVIDVGVNRYQDRLTGDVDTESCLGIASYITPVPGGVGPMTIAMLMNNTLRAYELQHQLQPTT